MDLLRLRTARAHQRPDVALAPVDATTTRILCHEGGRIRQVRTESFGSSVRSRRAGHSSPGGTPRGTQTAPLDFARRRVVVGVAAEQPIPSLRASVYSPRGFVDATYVPGLRIRGHQFFSFQPVSRGASTAGAQRMVLAVRIPYRRPSDGRDFFRRCSGGSRHRRGPRDDAVVDSFWPGRQDRAMGGIAREPRAPCPTPQAASVRCDPVCGANLRRTQHLPPVREVLPTVLSAERSEEALGTAHRCACPGTPCRGRG